MMGRLNHDQEQFFYSFHLDEAVPNDLHPIQVENRSNLARGFNSPAHN
jgi:hypothetical protein